MKQIYHLNSTTNIYNRVEIKNSNLTNFELAKKYYLFVAIDRATRLMFYEVYDAEISENTKDFTNKCFHFFPLIFEILIFL